MRAVHAPICRSVGDSAFCSAPAMAARPAAPSTNPRVVLPPYSHRVLPLMIGWFALNVPSGLSLYYFANTVFTAAQQIYLKKLGGAWSRRLAADGCACGCMRTPLRLGSLPYALWLTRAEM